VPAIASDWRITVPIAAALATLNRPSKNPRLSMKSSHKLAGKLKFDADNDETPHWFRASCTKARLFGDGDAATEPKAGKRVHFAMNG
jgi:hypothetical protein